MSVKVESSEEADLALRIEVAAAVAKVGIPYVILYQFWSVLCTFCGYRVGEIVTRYPTDQSRDKSWVLMFACNHATSILFFFCIILQIFEQCGLI